MKGSICLTAALAVPSMALAADSVTPGNNYVPADSIPWVDEVGAPVQLGPLWGDRAIIFLFNKTPYATEFAPAQPE